MLETRQLLSAVGVVDVASIAEVPLEGVAQNPAEGHQMPVLSGGDAAYVPNELLVQFQPGAAGAARDEVRGAVQATLAQSMHTPAMIAAGRGTLERISLPVGMTVEHAKQILEHNPNVLYAEPNWVYSTQAVSDDPYYTSSSQLWGMYSDDSPALVGPSGTTNQFGSQAEEAWEAGSTGSSSVFVGIIDEGFQYTHPDLAVNSWTNPYDPADGIDNDGNGYVDDIHGWDFFYNDNSTYDGTVDDHGTHVAGTIGGEGGNGVGVAGVNWDVTMISAKFLGPTGGSTSGAILALDYLTDLKVRHGINIVATNNSWAGGGFSQGLLDAITRAANQGILFVAAAGNSNKNNDTSANYPSNYSTLAGAGYEAVIAVAAINSSGAKSSFSSYGATTVDLGAPGEAIYSSVPTDSYASYSGTSMATPHVTGAAALYASVNPDATAAQIRDAILNSTTATSSLAGVTVTGGRLNISGMLLLPPSLSIDDTSAYEANSGTKTVTFTVTLSSSQSEIVTVDYATADGTATAGSDYVATSGSLSFAPGVRTRDIIVTINGDTGDEANETFFVNLTNVSSNASIADSQGKGTIRNDDHPIAPPSGLISWWSGDGHSSDVVGKNPGTLKNGATFATGLVGNAFSLDGVDDYISVAHDSSLNTSTGLTIEAWIKSDSTSGPHAILSKWNDNTSDQSYIFKDHNNSDKLRMELFGLADLPGSTNIPVGTWTHVAATYDNNVVSLYFDGILDASLTAVGAIRSSVTDLLIGAVFTGGGVSEYFDGLIDELAIYNRALLPGEIQSIYDAGPAGKIKPVTKFFVVNDGAPDLMYQYDSSGAAAGSYGMASGAAAPRGATSNAAGTTTWIVDANRKVYVYSATGVSQGSWTASNFNQSAQLEGIATNGTDVWILDRKSDKVYRYTGAASRLSGSQAAASSFSLNSGNSNGKGLVTDGTSIWVVDDGSTDKVFKYSLTGTLLGSWTISTSGASQPTGLTINPTNVSDIWVVDAGADKVFQYTGAATRTSGSQSASANFTLAAGNTNPQDIADPPAGIGTPLAPNSFVPAPSSHDVDSLFRLLAANFDLDCGDNDWPGSNRTWTNRPYSRVRSRNG